MAILSTYSRMLAPAPWKKPAIPSFDKILVAQSIDPLNFSDVPETIIIRRRIVSHG